MKKRYWILLAVAVLLILSLPIPRGTCDDGGTRVYQALTYKVVVWNRLNGEEVYHKTSVYWLRNGFKSVDELWEIEKPEEEAPEYIEVWRATRDREESYSSTEHAKWQLFTYEYDERG